MDLFKDEDKNQKKKPSGFNILANNPKVDHGGYGAGVLNLDNISPVIVDPEDNQAYIDMGALHARSAVEKRIKFLPNREEVPNGRLYWLVWVTVNNKGEGPFYYGVTGCEMTVDEEIRRGYKSLPEHVNKMDKSLKGHVMIEDMDDKSKKLLGVFLKEHNEEFWNRSDEKLRTELLGE
ncbi:YwhD family protein [Bacillus sp. FJAT-45350]|uniref:YwhD family protein n=1 Tax=Bacillus sp. FJAT-45350 TaxID=2011014 RepID=UPI000BB8E770|nr:YwhD family protein [Bacillus sp. FJAT-45350]